MAIGPNPAMAFPFSPKGFQALMGGVVVLSNSHGKDFPWGRNGILNVYILYIPDMILFFCFFNIFVWDQLVT